MAWQYTKLNYLLFDRVFKTTGYKLVIPLYPTLRGRPFRILVSQHGSREDADDIGAESYLTYPIDLRDNNDVAFDDPFWYDLIVVAPNFPPSKSAPPGFPNGMSFNNLDGSESGLQWLNDLVHSELPRVLQEISILENLNLTVEMDKFYFFGHSRGGMALNKYIMKFEGKDLFAAASCSGRFDEIDNPNGREFSSMSINEYLRRLDAFITTPVVSILGTHEAENADTGSIKPTGISRIENIRAFICRFIQPRVGINGLARVLPDVDPPVPLFGNPNISCNAFRPPIINQSNPFISNIKYHFWWRTNGHHVGSGNYTLARTFLFARRERKPVLEMIWHDPVSFFKIVIGVLLRKKDPLKESLRNEIEEKLPERLRDEKIKENPVHI